MKKYFLFTLPLLSFLLLAFSSQAQFNTTSHWGPKMKTTSASSLFSGVFAYNNQGLFGLRYEKRNYFIDHYSADLQPLNKGELNLEEGNNEKTLEKILYMNGKIYMFTSFVNTKLDKNFLFVQTLNQTSFAPASDIKNVAEIDVITRMKSGGFNFRTSRDSSKLLVVVHLPFKRGESEKFQLIVFDDNMNKLWSRDIVLPYNDELFTVNDFVVDNVGNAYIQGIQYNDVARTRRGGKPNYTYKIFAYNASGGAEKEYTAKLTDRFITDLQLEILNNGNLVCAGFYSEMGTYSIKGTYYLIIDDESNLITKESVKDFTIDFITQNLSDKEERKAEKKDEKGKNVELYEYDLDYLNVMDDGTIVMVAEQFFIRVVTTTSTVNGVTTTRTTYYYYYNDIITIFISAEGDIMSMVKIPKRQVTVNDGGYISSYVKCIHKDKVYFIFNDHPENLTLTDGDRFKYMGRGDNRIPVMVEVNKDGSYTKKALEIPEAEKEEMMTVIPKLSDQYSSNKILLMMKKRKTEQFATIDFK